MKEPHTYGELCAAPSEAVKLGSVRPASQWRRFWLVFLTVLTLGWREH